MIAVRCLEEKPQYMASRWQTKHRCLASCGADTQDWLASHQALPGVRFSYQSPRSGWGGFFLDRSVVFRFCGGNKTNNEAFSIVVDKRKASGNVFLLVQQLKCVQERYIRKRQYSMIHTHSFSLGMYFTPRWISTISVTI